MDQYIETTMIDACNRSNEDDACCSKATRAKITITMGSDDETIATCSTTETSCSSSDDSNGGIMKVEEQQQKQQHPQQQEIVDTRIRRSTFPRALMPRLKRRPSIYIDHDSNGQYHHYGYYKFGKHSIPFYVVIFGKCFRLSQSTSVNVDSVEIDEATSPPKSGNATDAYAYNTGYYYQYYQYLNRQIRHILVSIWHGIVLVLTYCSYFCENGTINAASKYKNFNLPINTNSKHHLPNSKITRRKLQTQSPLVRWLMLMLLMSVMWLHVYTYQQNASNKQLLHVQQKFNSSSNSADAVVATVGRTTTEIFSTTSIPVTSYSKQYATSSSAAENAATLNSSIVSRTASLIATPPPLQATQDEEMTSMDDQEEHHPHQPPLYVENTSGILHVHGNADYLMVQHQPFSSMLAAAGRSSSSTTDPSSNKLFLYQNSKQHIADHMKNTNSLSSSLSMFAYKS